MLDQASVQAFQKHLTKAGKFPATVESYSRDAAIFVEYCTRFKVGASDIKPHLVKAYHEHLLENHYDSPNSVRRALIGVRQFMRFLSDTNHWGDSPFDEYPIPGRLENLPEILDEEDFDALIDVARSGKPALKALRDYVILLLLGAEGVKATELIDLRWQDFIVEKFEQQQEQQPRGYLTVAGQRQRQIRLAYETTDAIIAYRDAFTEFSRSHQHEYSAKNYMIASYKGRDYSLRLPQMTRHGLKFIIYELGEKSGLKGLNSELLRHHAVRHLLASGLSPAELMRHLGLRRLGNIAKHLNAMPQTLTETPAETQNDMKASPT